MNSTKKTVLIADDDPDCLFQLKFLLEKLGHEVIAMESQRMAEDWLAHNKPDLAIFDLMMDREDSGFILSRNCKKKYPEVKVIILTAVTPETGISFDLHSQESKHWIKADLYIEKGMDHATLGTQVTELLK